MSSVATTQTYILHRTPSIQQEEEEILSMACVADREAAVREVTQVYELIKLRQPLLLLHSQQPPPSTTQLAQSLLGMALRALNVALSVIKQQQQQPAAAPVTPTSVVKAEPHQLSPHSPASADSEAIAPSRPSTATRGAKRRRSSVAMEGKKKTSSSWETLTAAPYDDGYEWRKYGEKKINGTLFTRSYFRCTYKDDAGCLATKHVQQMDNSSDPPMFHVTYNNDHNCCSSAKANTGRSSSSKLAALLAAGCCDMKQEQATGRQHAAAAAVAMNMKQEPPLLLLPALVDLQPSDACFPPHEQIPQLCGAFRDDDGEIPSATGSCISGETSWGDGYSGDDMAAQMAVASAGDDPLHDLHDLERFLLWDGGFMDY